MIDSFLASWPLFHDAYLAGWAIAALLATIGVVVLARDQIFLGAAVAQASTLGIALGMWLAPILRTDGTGEDVLPFVAASVFAIAAAALPSPAVGRNGASDEARAGWVFLASSSGAILLMARSPHGLEEVHRLLASSLIGATGTDVALFAGMFAAMAVFLALRRRHLLLVAMEPAMAEAVGIRVRLWSAVLSVVLGFVLAQAIRVSGTLYALGCLVLPGLAAKALGGEALPLFWRAPAVALAGSIVGFVAANHWDLPPAQLTIGLLALAALPSLARRV